MNVKMKKSYFVSKDILIFFIEWLIWFILSLILCSGVDDLFNNVHAALYVFSVIGVIQFVRVSLSIKRMQGQLFSPYWLFYCFLFVFSYGQFAMWAFGIHYETEMTVTTFIRYIDEFTALKIQVLSLQLFSIFHIGALLAFGFRHNKTEITYKVEAENSVLKFIALPILIISGAINITYTYIGFNMASSIGYSALFDIAMPPLLKYLSYMFIPSIFLNLIVRGFSKRAFTILSSIFLLYAIPLLIIGDRGSWVYFLGPWLWCFIRYVNIPSQTNGAISAKKSRKKMIISIILVALIIYSSALFVSVRDVGRDNLAYDDFSFGNLFLPFVKPFFEMGQSAGLLGVIEQDGLYKTWSYGNTYNAAILGMVLPSIRALFGYYVFYIENWMSQYLQMGNYGVGFSAFAEAYLNGGPLFSWFYMLLYGYFIGSLALVKKETPKTNYRKLFIVLATVTVLGPSVRASMDLFLRQFFWGVLTVLLITTALSPRLRRFPASTRTIEGKDEG